jgi:hypothetical protein
MSIIRARSCPPVHLPYRGPASHASDRTSTPRASLREARPVGGASSQLRNRCRRPNRRRPSGIAASLSSGMADELSGSYRCKGLGSSASHVQPAGEQQHVPVRVVVRKCGVRRVVPGRARGGRPLASEVLSQSLLLPAVSGLACHVRFAGALLRFFDSKLARATWASRA